ncbi:MAG: hypothetical protein ABSC29_02965 [Minisyncoccia bacterium]
MGIFRLCFVRHAGCAAARSDSPFFGASSVVNAAVNAATLAIVIAAIKGCYCCAADAKNRFTDTETRAKNCTDLYGDRATTKTGATTTATAAGATTATSTSTAANTTTTTAAASTTTGATATTGRNI